MRLLKLSGNRGKKKPPLIASRQCLLDGAVQEQGELALTEGLLQPERKLLQPCHLSSLLPVGKEGLLCPQAAWLSTSPHHSSLTGSWWKAECPEW